MCISGSSFCFLDRLMTISRRPWKRLSALWQRVMSRKTLSWPKRLTHETLIATRKLWAILERIASTLGRCAIQFAALWSGIWWHSFLGWHFVCRCTFASSFSFSSWSLPQIGETEKIRCLASHAADSLVFKLTSHVVSFSQYEQAIRYVHVMSNLCEESIQVDT